jgi:hypothetical protein
MEDAERTDQIGHHHLQDWIITASYSSFTGDTVVPGVILEETLM